MDLTELMKGLDEAWAEDSKAVLDALKTGPGTLYHTAFQSGFNEAEQRREGQLKTLKAEKEEAETKLAEAATRISELEEKSPNVEKITRQWEEKLKATKSKLEAERDDARTQLRNSKATSELDRFEKMLLAKKVDPDKAFVLRQKNADRFKPEGEGADTKVVITEAGKDIPLTATGEKTPLDVLVEEVLPTIEPKWFTEPVDTNGSGAGKGGAPSGSKNRYQKIREETKAEVEEREKNSSTDELGKRLGVTA